MIRALKLALAASLALSAVTAAPTYAAEKAKKIAKIKLDTLKPGKIKLDPRLGGVDKLPHPEPD